MSNARMVRVFVNGAPIEVPAGSTALDAVRTWSSTAAGEVTGGSRLIADSRGLPIDSSTPVPAGSILRLIANRAGSNDGAPAAPDA
ncbi:MAG TPA: hypothetical protein VII52_06860 [Gemmatimonadaceae bacterium]